jgi:hypothetical protein
MAAVYRADLNLGRLRTHLFKTDGVGRDNAAVAAWLADRGFWRDQDRWLGEESALAGLPPGVVTHRGDRVEAAPWQGDPVYALIFGMADDAWQFYCRDNDPTSRAWRFVLVEEYVADHGGLCRGPVLRAWCRDTDGLREIAEQERLEHHGACDGVPVYPFTLLMFRIRPGRDRVVLGHRHASTAGTGGTYLVQQVGERLELDPDPDSDFWIS